MVDTSKEAIEALISKGWPDCPQDARKMISALRAELDAAKAENERLRGVLGKDETRINHLIRKLENGVNGTGRMNLEVWVEGWKSEINEALKGASHG